MQSIDLKASERSVTGKMVRDLRRDDIIPGVIYGKNFQSRSIQIDYRDFEYAYKTAGESTVVNLKIGEQSFPTIIKDIATDRINSRIIHADFYKVNLDEKIHATIALEFIGESPAVKDLGGILVKNIKEIKVLGLPNDLPNKIEVDISSLKKFNDHILVSGLAISDKLEIGNKGDEIVVLIQEPISQEEFEKSMEAPTASVEDVEVGIKKKEEEAETESDDVEGKPAEKTEEKK